MEGYEPPSKDKKGTRTLTDDELKAVRNASGNGSRVVSRLMILWGTRNEETTVLDRKWRVEDVLTIPGEHTKNGRAHAIPLLPLARSVLNERPQTGSYYFPGRYSNEKCLAVGSLIARLVSRKTLENPEDFFSPKAIGCVVRSKLGLPTVKSNGVYVIPNTARQAINALAVRYGLSPEEATNPTDAPALGFLARSAKYAPGA